MRPIMCRAMILCAGRRTRLPHRSHSVRVLACASTMLSILGAAALPASAQVTEPGAAVPGPVQPPHAATNPFTGLGSSVVVNDNITATEQEALQQAQGGVSDPTAAKELLGKLILYDRNLSHNRQQACTTCHTKEAGFTGGISTINQTVMSYSGALFYRWSQRKPQDYAYAPFAPVLHYDSGLGKFVGGNFWDLRATGEMTGNPSGDQAMQPLIDPLEMELPDPACVAWRISNGPYSAFFQQVWGTQSLAITWPSSTEAQCSQPQSVQSANPAFPTFDEEVHPPEPIALSDADRATAMAAWRSAGLAAATYEAGPEVSPFSSKFDYVLKGQASLTAQEQQGYALFTGRAGCSQCHDASGAQPLFTDWTTANLGIPKNTGNVFYTQTQPDNFGFVGDPEGLSYVDEGLANFLESPSNTHADWKALASNFHGNFQVATLRNVAKVPYPGFVKDYMHNGYFKNLKDVVHFYNTRNVLPTCPGDLQDRAKPPIGDAWPCWPAAEESRDVTKQIGNLGLSDSDEDAIVAFLNTLSDGYTPGQTGD